ncbi:BirA family transcriptional regulator, biotin operon repressor / biotin-[acetyl-CoA-carboxylase] ligase [Austwickia chelonae]|uniref:Putative biotin--[acetyl-CoA-carboxylase] ligase n=2 Tax=Austwickia TaxID=1184606 RepID=K6VN12_9MICO|nr:putative biotin--[acetyl-CoA-carboxylase] ligase [Austwickia chelonae NBRC 105200]SEW30373.1 BirA family transcriptional regulator, biotin operon repressor / biotin-[acetyl-CoA-carboxylase] ligase [Austwickia chelonae]
MALSEDPLRATLVTPESPWRQVDCYEEVGSTNAVSAADPQPWRVVTTRRQTQGRGRYTRVWESREGASVAMSLTVPLADDPRSWGWLPLTTGLAVAEALGELTGAPARFVLKWPNDVLICLDDGQYGKVCGILCETVPAPATGGAPLVVAGIGVNIALTQDELPVPTATSLALAGLSGPDGELPGGGDVVIAIARAFAARHAQWARGGEDLERLRSAYRQCCSTLGAAIDVHLPGDLVVRGQGVDVADGGEIVVDTADGRRTFAAGDVVHVRPGTEEDQA